MILVLSLGGREYFLCSLFMLIIYRSVYFQRITRKAALNVFSAIFVATGVFGVIWLKETLSLGGAVINVFIEPLWTGFSLIYFLKEGAFEIIRFPIFLVSNFINLIPFLLLPNKMDFMLNPVDYGFIIFSPGGAENSLLLVYDQLRHSGNDAVHGLVWRISKLSQITRQKPAGPGHLCAVVRLAWVHIFS